MITLLGYGCSEACGFSEKNTTKALVLGLILDIITASALLTCGLLGYEGVLSCSHSVQLGLSVGGGAFLLMICLGFLGLGISGISDDADGSVVRDRTPSSEDDTRVTNGAEGVTITVDQPTA